MKPLLFLHGITLTFGGLSVIDNLDIQVRKGSRCGLIGPNGAGKTTIFNLLSGVYRATAGEILLDDEPIDDVPLDRRIDLGIGRTFQNLRLMKHLTVLENIMLGQHRLVGSWARILAPLGGRWNRAWRDEAMEVAETLGLRDDVDRLAQGLSYGVQKRIEIARALVGRPRLLLLDEPAAGLNSSEREELVTVLASSLPRDTTVLIVEHDTGFVRTLCDHTVALNFGRKIAEGDPASVCGHPLVVEAYLGKDEPIYRNRPQPALSNEAAFQRNDNAA
ncbi:ABC transporter ATP-binding protein [Bradyrhizobium sp. dw_78]|uniref:ABC transporter ATP-binding protein n=1 Tax=Bradyrhizobium sp. dw_78 TaxID=2719793 RepID=UPI001BD1D15D|nr:ABC transporter ATP-binding protein [Bradyrhizobium sp. dw_78]